MPPKISKLRERGPRPSLLLRNFMGKEQYIIETMRRIESVEGALSPADITELQKLLKEIAPTYTPKMSVELCAFSRVEFQQGVLNPYATLSRICHLLAENSTDKTTKNDYIRSGAVYAGHTLRLIPIDIKKDIATRQFLTQTPMSEHIAAYSDYIYKIRYQCFLLLAENFFLNKEYLSALKHLFCAFINMHLKFSGTDHDGHLICTFNHLPNGGIIAQPFVMVDSFHMGRNISFIQDFNKLMSIYQLIYAVSIKNFPYMSFNHEHFTDAITYLENFMHAPALAFLLPHATCFFLKYIPDFLMLVNQAVYIESANLDFAFQLFDYCESLYETKSSLDAHKGPNVETPATIPVSADTASTEKYVYQTVVTALGTLDITETPEDIFENYRERTQPMRLLRAAIIDSGRTLNHMDIVAFFKERFRTILLALSEARDERLLSDFQSWLNFFNFPALSPYQPLLDVYHLYQGGDYAHANQLLDNVHINAFGTKNPDLHALCRIIKQKLLIQIGIGNSETIIATLERKFNQVSKEEKRRPGKKRRSGSKKAQGQKRVTKTPGTDSGTREIIDLHINKGMEIVKNPSANIEVFIDTIKNLARGLQSFSDNRPTEDHARYNQILILLIQIYNRLSQEYRFYRNYPLMQECWRQAHAYVKRLIENNLKSDIFSSLQPASDSIRALYVEINSFASNVIRLQGLSTDIKTVAFLSSQKQGLEDVVSNLQNLLKNIIVYIKAPIPKLTNNIKDPAYYRLQEELAYIAYKANNLDGACQVYENAMARLPIPLPASLFFLKIQLMLGLQECSIKQANQLSSDIRTAAIFFAKSLRISKEIIAEILAYTQFTDISQLFDEKALPDTELLQYTVNAILALKSSEDVYEKFQKQLHKKCMKEAAIVERLKRTKQKAIDEGRYGKAVGKRAPNFLTQLTRTHEQTLQDCTDIATTIESLYMELSSKLSCYIKSLIPAQSTSVTVHDQQGSSLTVSPSPPTTKFFQSVPPLEAPNDTAETLSKMLHKKIHEGEITLEDYNGTIAQLRDLITQCHERSDYKHHIIPIYLHLILALHKKSQYCASNNDFFQATTLMTEGISEAEHCGTFCDAILENPGGWTENDIAQASSAKLFLQERSNDMVKDLAPLLEKKALVVTDGGTRSTVVATI